MALKRPSINASKYTEDEDDVKVPGKVAEETTPAEDPYEDEDAEETPKVGTSLQAGWDAAETVLKSAPKGDFAEDFVWSDEPQLVKFLGDGPVASFLQHWINNPPEDITKKRSFTCLRMVDEDCPLCGIGDKPSAKFTFSLVTIAEDVSEAQALTVAPTVFDMLKAKNTARSGPLTKHYYSMSRVKGANKKYTYSIEVVKPTDLAEEWDLDPADVATAVAGVEPLGSEVVTFTPRTELLKIARAIA